MVSRSLVCVVGDVERSFFVWALSVAARLVVGPVSGEEEAVVSLGVICVAFAVADLE